VRRHGERATSQEVMLAALFDWTRDAVLLAAFACGGQRRRTERG